MRRTAILLAASGAVVVLCAFLIKARNLAAARVHGWPVTMTGSPLSCIKINAGEVPDGSPEEQRLEGAAPFVLCKALRQYPLRDYPFSQFSIQWSSTHEAMGLSPLTVELNYDRAQKTLVRVGYGIGDAHGTRYDNVTDDKLFKIADEAGYFGKADLRDLEKNGCPLSHY